jgi:hypothetical protein
MLTSQMRDLLQGDNLFLTKGLDGKDSAPVHAAQMIALLGPPRPEMLPKRPRTGESYNEKGELPLRYAIVHIECSSLAGNWRGLAEMPSINLEDTVTVLEGVERRDFLAFARKMLQWDGQEKLCERVVCRSVALGLGTEVNTSIFEDKVDYLRDIFTTLKPDRFRVHFCGSKSIRMSSADNN